MQIVEMDLTAIKPYEKNPRKNDDAVEAVVNSIREFGFKVPLVLDQDNVIVTGHTRYKAAKRLKLKTVPCIMADDLTPEQIKAYRLADNKVSELAEWDFDLLDEELAGIFDIDMDVFGFIEQEDEEPAEPSEDNYEVVLPVEPIAKLGDVYQLGEHRLICGDCTDLAQVDLLMDGNTAQLVLTDPPYNMAYEGAGNTNELKRKSNRILNDKMSDSDFADFMASVNGSIHYVMDDGASFYIFYKEMGTGVFLTSLKQAALNYKQTLVWVKNSIVLGGSKYQSMYEPCIFGCKGKSIKSWYVGRKERSVIEEVDLMDEDELRETLRTILNEDDTDIVRVEKNRVNDLHPTMKPIKLLAKLLTNSSQQGDIVVDFFGGSGSTLIACEQLGRKCYTSELDPKYVDVIIDRWETFTGEKAVKIC